MIDTAPSHSPAALPLCLSITETAAALRVSRRKIYVLMQTQGLPSILLGGRRLIRAADLEQWLAARPVAAGGEQ